MPRLSHDAKLKAFYERNQAYAGLFYIGVKTTGIFCRTGCTARAPKPENIQFFDTAKEALDAGFRPCKVCRPLECVGETPPEIRSLLDEVHGSPASRISDGELRSRGIPPATIRRWFKKHHGITFQAYQRYIKIGTAVKKLQTGERVTDVALENYDSLSGFQDSFKNALGVSPAQSAGKTVILVTRIPTPLGLMMAATVNDELCLLEFCDRRMLATELDQIQSLTKGVLIAGHCALFDELRRQLADYFVGTLTQFTVPMMFLGTPFQQSVWRALVTIPYGKTRSYKQQAEMIGQPDAVRAVARANGQNRISIIIPCHRVIGSDGGLTGYGGGLERKAWLLNHEREHEPFGTHQTSFLHS